MSFKKKCGERVSLRTRQIVIKQRFDDICGKIDMDAVVLLAAGYLSV